MAVVKRKPFAESFRVGFFVCLNVCKSACTNIFVDQSARIWKLLKSRTSGKVTPIFVHFVLRPQGIFARYVYVLYIVHMYECV